MASPTGKEPQPADSTGVEGPEPKRSLLAAIEARLNLTEAFSFLTSFGLFPVELDTNKPLRQAVREALAKPMPSYARWPRVLSILSVLLFAFLAVTGVLLALHYQPTTEAAHDSVTILARDVHFGWFVHQIHGWAATLLVAILLLRLWRFFFQGLYKAPRELIWIGAVLSLGVAWLADLTGRLLSWDTVGYWRTVRGLEVIQALPVLGDVFSFVVGGANLDSLVLLRFYVLHVLVLPAVLLALFYLHFSGVRRVGLATGAGERSAQRGFRQLSYNLLIMAVFMLGGLVTLATLLPGPTGKEADPFSTPAGIHPPWYFLAYHAMLESLPSVMPRWSRGLLIEITALVVLCLPFLDRTPHRTLRERWLATTLGGCWLGLWGWLVWIGYHMEKAP